VDHELVLNVLGFDVFYIIEIIGYFLFALIGSCLKEVYLYRIRQTTTHKGRMIRIIIGTIVATFLSLAFKDLFLTDRGTWKVMSFISFLFGVLGFDLFGKLSSIDGIKDLARDIRDVKHIVTHDDEGDSPNHNKEKPDITDETIKK
jgi:hypothetical protein